MPKNSLKLSKEKFIETTENCFNNFLKIIKKTIENENKNENKNINILLKTFKSYQEQLKNKENTNNLKNYLSSIDGLLKKESQVGGEYIILNNVKVDKHFNFKLLKKKISDLLMECINYLEAHHKSNNNNIQDLTQENINELNVIINKSSLVFDFDEFNNIFKKINIVIKKNLKNKQLINDIFDYLLMSKSYQELMEKIQLKYINTKSFKNFSLYDVIHRLRQYQKDFNEGIYSLNINRGKRKNQTTYQLPRNNTYNLANSSYSNPVYSFATPNGSTNSSSNPVYNSASSSSTNNNNNIIYNSATMNGLISSSNPVYNLNKIRGRTENQKIDELFSNTYNTPQFSINSQGYQTPQNALLYYSTPQIHPSRTLRRNQLKTTLRRTPSFHRPGEVVYVGTSSHPNESLYEAIQGNNRSGSLYESIPGNNRGELLYETIEDLTRKANTSTPQTKRNILQQMKNGVFKRLPNFFKSKKTKKAIKTPPNLSIRASNRKVNTNPNQSQNDEYLNNGFPYNELNPLTFNK